MGYFVGMLADEMWMKA